MHEACRGLSKALLTVSAGVGVWCSGELGLASSTLLLLLSHSPGDVAESVEGIGWQRILHPQECLKATKSDMGKEPTKDITK